MTLSLEQMNEISVPPYILLQAIRSFLGQRYSGTRNIKNNEYYHVLKETGLL